MLFQQIQGNPAAENMKDTEAPGEAELQTVGLAATGGDPNCGDTSRPRLKRELMHQVGDHQVKYDNYETDLMSTSDLEDTGLNIRQYQDYEPWNLEPKSDDRILNNEHFSSEWSGDHISSDEVQQYWASAAFDKPEQPLHWPLNYSSSQVPGASLEGIQSPAVETPLGPGSEDVACPTTGEGAGADGTQMMLGVPAGSSRSSLQKTDSSSSDCVMGFLVCDKQADPTKQCAQPGNHRSPSQPEVNGHPLPGNGMQLQPMDEHDKDTIITRVPNWEDAASRFTVEAAGTGGIQNLHPGVFVPSPPTIDVPPSQSSSSKDEAFLSTGVAAVGFGVGSPVYGGELSLSVFLPDNMSLAVVPRPETDCLAHSVQGTQSQITEVPGPSSKEKASPTTGEGEGVDGTQMIPGFPAGSSRPSKGTKRRGKKTKARENSHKSERGSNWKTEEMLIIANIKKQSVADGKKANSALILEALASKGYKREEKSLRHCWDNLRRYTKQIDDYDKSNRINSKDSSSLDGIFWGMSEIERKEKDLPPPSFTLPIYNAVSFVQKDKGTKPVRGAGDGRVRKRRSSTIMKEDEGLPTKTTRIQDAGPSEPSPSSCPNTSTILTGAESSCIPPSSGTVNPRSEFDDQLAEIQAGNHDLKEIRSRELSVQKQRVMLESAAQIGEANREPVNIVHQRAQTEDERENSPEVRMALRKNKLMKERKDLYRRKKRIEEELEGLEKMAGGFEERLFRENDLREQEWKICKRMEDIEEELKSLN